MFGAVVLLIGGFLGWYVYSNGLYGGVNQGAKTGEEKQLLSCHHLPVLRKAFLDLPELKG